MARVLSCGTDLADVAFAGLVRRHRPVGHNEAGDTVGGQMVDEVLDPCIVGVSGWRDAVFPAGILTQTVTTPVGIVERRVGHDEVGLEVFVQVRVEAVGLLGAEVGINAADGEVHLGEAPGGEVGLLAVDGDALCLA